MMIVDILLNTKKVYFIKDDKLILQGTINKLGGLWDILVYKTEINTNNFKTPKTNAVLHIKQNTRKAQLINKTSNHISQKFKTPRSSTLCTEFRHINQLVEMNECNTLVKSQIKEDRI